MNPPIMAITIMAVPISRAIPRTKSVRLVRRIRARFIALAMMYLIVRKIKNPTIEIKKATIEIKNPTIEIAKNMMEIKNPTIEIAKNMMEIKKLTIEITRHMMEIKSLNLKSHVHQVRKRNLVLKNAILLIKNHYLMFYLVQEQGKSEKEES